MKNQVLVIGVVFPEILKYYNSYLKTLTKQSINKYDLLILNDNTSVEVYDDIQNINYINIIEKKSPAQIRDLGIKYAINNNYKYLIFTDTDDYYQYDRIEKSLMHLREADFVFNEISLVDDKNKLLMANVLAKINAPKKITDYHEIMDYNFLGLSNTAINLAKCQYIYIPAEVIAVDWWLYMLLLLNSKKGKFIIDTISYYRQHSSNLVGMNNPLDESRLAKSINIKMIHYASLEQYCRDHLFEKQADEISMKLENMKELKKKLKDDHFKAVYIERINKNMKSIYKGWWSEILELKKWEKYE